MAESASEDRTQAPSERRLARAREAGQVPLSREVAIAAGLGGAALLLALQGPALARSLIEGLAAMLATPEMEPGAALRRAGLVWLRAAVPFAATIGLCGGTAVLLQSRFLLHLTGLLPDLGRISPMRGLSRLASPANLVETGKSFLKLAVLGWAVWSALRRGRDLLMQAPLWPAGLLLEQVGRELVHLVLVVAALQAVIAALDLGWTRWRFTQRLRMSREDQREEQREMEGDPRVKGRLRQIRLARARKRMMAQVAKATVVITNPTHFAVALAYQRGGQGAPRVVAKGADEVAARIRAAAQESGVPLVSNPPLARALYLVPLDAEIPAEHFRLVAEIIAYVWRLRQPAR